MPMPMPAVVAADGVAVGVTVTHACAQTCPTGGMRPFHEGVASVSGRVTAGPTGAIGDVREVGVARGA